MLLKAHGDPYPRPDARVINAQMDSLRKAKQGISWFMPNKGTAWIDGFGGNPTRHSQVHDVIRSIEAKEVKGLGVSANDKRAYREAEFMKVLELFCEQQDFDHQMKCPLMMHRLDDTCHFHVNAPHGNINFPFILKMKTKWSKNVRTMKHCPDQILLASDDWKTCVILWLAIYL